jgi:Na+-driven multidrug efflux pump
LLDSILSLLTSDPTILALGHMVLLIDVFLEIGRCFNLVLVRNLQAAGDVRFPVLVSIASQWIIAVGLSWHAGHASGTRAAGRMARVYDR